MSDFLYALVHLLSDKLLPHPSFYVNTHKKLILNLINYIQLTTSFVDLKKNFYEAIPIQVLNCNFCIA